MLMTSLGFSIRLMTRASWETEQTWGTLQDRLVVELRLETITTIADANGPGEALGDIETGVRPPLEALTCSWPVTDSLAADIDVEVLVRRGQGRRETCRS